jgi:hypothetical protein
MPWFDDITDLHAQSEPIRQGRHGMIEAVAGEFLRVQLRPFPRLISLPEIAVLGRYRHRRVPADHCRLFYDQPRRFPNFLAVKYLVSGRGTSYQTLLRCLQALDEIARIKQTDALLCDLANARISDRSARRHGWEPHCPRAWHRNFIKRFYGVYPEPPEWLREDGRSDQQGPAWTAKPPADDAPGWPREPLETS